MRRPDGFEVPRWSGSRQAFVRCEPERGNRSDEREEGSRARAPHRDFQKNGPIQHLGRKHHNDSL